MKVSCILNFNGDIHVGGVNFGNVVNFNPSHDAARERGIREMIFLIPK